MNISGLGFKKKNNNTALMKARNYVHCERIRSRTNIWGRQKMREPLAAKAGTYGHLTQRKLLPRHRRLIVLAQQCVCSMWHSNNPLLGRPQACL